VAIPNFFKKLLFSRQFIYEDGKFFLMMKVPGIILPMGAFVSFVRQYVKDSGNQARKHLFEVGRSQGKDAGKRYVDVASGSFPNFASFVKDVAEVMGLGKVTHIKKDGDKITGSFSPSVFAETHKKMFGKSTKPVCDYLCGVATGVFEPFVGHPLEGKETRCKAKGDIDCHFVLTRAGGDEK
jgi:predicted hydrocarbon binding protein